MKNSILEEQIEGDKRSEAEILDSVKAAFGKIEETLDQQFRCSEKSELKIQRLK